MSTPTIDGPAVLELMGHRRLAGRVSEVLVGGATLLRIDVPRKDGSTVTQFYSVSSVYCITPTTEEIARAVALANPPEPIHPWELRAALPAGPTTDAEVIDRLRADPAAGCSPVDEGNDDEEEDLDDDDLDDEDLEDDEV
jgi:hypothetical protein